MATELNENSTHEDIQKMVDEIIKDKHGEETPEPAAESTDAQKVAEDHDEPVLPEDTTVTEDEDAGEPEDGQEWLTDEVRADAAAYGMDEDDLAEFTSREELDRAVRFLNKALLGNRAEEAPEEGVKRDERGRFQKEGATQDETSSDGFDLGLDPDIWGEELVDSMERLQGYFEPRLAALEEHVMLQQAKAEEALFDALVDNGGRANLFGKTGKETAKERQRRKQLFDALEVQREFQQRRGLSSDMSADLVEMAFRMAFPDEWEKQTIKNRTRQMTKQSEKILGAGQTKPPESPETARERALRRYKQLEGAG